MTDGRTDTGWKQLHNNEFLDLHCSPGIIRVLTSKRMRWAGGGGYVVSVAQRGNT
jgi:hypothetical protein